MAFVLNTPYGNIEPLLLARLAGLKQLFTTSPFTVAQAKTDIEASQPESFTTATWDAYLRALYDMQGGDIDVTQLTADEIDMFNKIREYLAPAPFTSHCSTADPESAGVTLQAIAKVGTAGHYEMRVQFTSPYSCSIVTVEATQTAGTLTPTNIPDMGLIGPLGTDGNTYAGVWLEFAEVPTGTYSYDLVFKDASGATVGSTINKSINF